MFTDCPACKRQFHIYAPQLSAAGGQVRCGFCGEQFNALERLHDKPAANPPAAEEQEQEAEPQFIIPEPQDREPEAASPRVEVEETEKPPAPHVKVDPAPKMVAGVKSAIAGLHRATEYGLTRDLLEQPEQKPALVIRVLWWAGILVMILFAATQLAWFNRDEIMSRYPGTVPWFQRVCEKVECEVIRHRDLSSIVLLNRDVRDHPRYEDALLVNATMSNQSQTLQAFPEVQLNLYDTEGNLIAYRRFKPEEYLDDSINILEGMKPNVPVHFVLEVLGSVEGAVSFEFEFH